MLCTPCFYLRPDECSLALEERVASRAASAVWAARPCRFLMLVRTEVLARAALCSVRSCALATLSTAGVHRTLVLADNLAARSLAPCDLPALRNGLLRVLFRDPVSWKVLQPSQGDVECWAAVPDAGTPSLPGRANVSGVRAWSGGLSHLTVPSFLPLPWPFVPAGAWRLSQPVRASRVTRLAEVVRRVDPYAMSFGAVPPVLGEFLLSVTARSRDPSRATRKAIDAWLTESRVPLFLAALSRSRAARERRRTWRAHVADEVLVGDAAAAAQYVHERTRRRDARSDAAWRLGKRERVLMSRRIAAAAAARSISYSAYRELFDPKHCGFPDEDVALVSGMSLASSSDRSLRSMAPGLCRRVYHDGDHVKDFD